MSGQYIESAEAREVRVSLYLMDSVAYQGLLTALMAREMVMRVARDALELENSLRCRTAYDSAKLAVQNTMLAIHRYRESVG